MTREPSERIQMDRKRANQVITFLLAPSLRQSRWVELALTSERMPSHFSPIMPMTPFYTHGSSRRCGLNLP